MPDETTVTSDNPLARTATGDAGLTDDSGSAGASESLPATATLEELRAELEREKKGRAAARRQEAEVRQQLSVLQTQTQMLLQQQQMAAARQPDPMPVQDVGVGRDGWTAEERKKFSSAIIDDNQAMIEELEARREERRERQRQAKFTADSRAAQAQAQANQSYQQYLASEAPELQQPDSPIAREITTRYSQMLSDPKYYWGLSNGFQVGSGTVYPSILTAAIKEIRSKHAGKRQEAEDDAIEGEAPTVERSSRNDNGKSRTASFNPMKHMTASERAMVDTIREKSDPGYSYARWWKYLPEAEKEKRLSKR